MNMLNSQDGTICVNLKVSHQFPSPGRQVLLPDDGELEDSSRRWQGRAVLLAWPHLEGLQLEVREESQHTHQAGSWG
jgi:hypothetical protein